MIFSENRLINAMYCMPPFLSVENFIWDFEGFELNFLVGRCNFGTPSRDYCAYGHQAYVIFFENRLINSDLDVLYASVRKC